MTYVVVAFWLETVGGVALQWFPGVVGPVLLRSLVVFESDPTFDDSGGSWVGPLFPQPDLRSGGTIVA
jgi:hypothetical protein